jgi:hypothetical protein
MATQLKNIVRFVNVAAGATVALPHGLAISPPGGGELPQVPDICLPSGPGFQITADAINVTVTNETAGVLSIDVLVEHWHSLEREFGNVAVTDLVPQPFVVDLGADLLNKAAAVLGFGAGAIDFSAAVTETLFPWFDEDPASNTGEGAIVADMPLPRAGTVRNLFVRHNDSSGNGQPVVYTLWKNGVATALAVSLATGAIGQNSNLVNSVVCAQGDRLRVVASKAANIAASGDVDLQVVATVQFGV